MPGKLVAQPDVSSNEKPLLATTETMHTSADRGVPRSGKGSLDVHEEGDTSKALVNGLAAAQSDSLVLNQDPSKSSLELPSEIEHITVNFYPLSQLVERVSQECYTDLQHIITKLASPSAGAPVNGSDPAQAAGSERKLRWLEFANKHRERFIKLLVMLNWSRNVQDISKMIDLKVWMNQQEQMFNDCESWLGALRRDIQSVGLPSPDVPAALQVIKQGDLPQYSTLSYIPKAPLAATEVLAVLKRINTTLHVRLNIHQDLPPALRDFSISSGRVTFRAADRFELDLSIADEDPASQFYFIDFRFLFPTRSEIPAGQFRSQLEARANRILADEGLTGCFAFFNDYVLTHKTNLFRRQALDLARGAWAGTIKVETLRRSLVVQYWIDRPEPKSWIEIGIARDRDITTKPTHPSNMSDLVWKWFRNGTEVHHAPLLPLSTPNMHLEQILKNAIALHTTSILCSIKKGLEHSMTAGASSRLKLACSDREPAKCMLRMSVGLPSTALLQLEPTTGSFSIAPSSSLAKRFEAKLNSSRNPSKNGARIIVSYINMSSHNHLREFAERSDWSIVEVSPPPDESYLRDFGRPVLDLSYFRPWPRTTCVLASELLPDLDGYEWWAAEISEVNPQRTTLIPGSAYFLHTSDNHLASGLSSLLERKTVSTLAYTKASRWLGTHRVPHSFGHYSLNGQSKLALAIDAAALLNGTRAAARPKGVHTESRLRANTIYLSENGLSPNTPARGAGPVRIIYKAYGRLDGTYGLNALRASAQPDISIDQNGDFIMHFEFELIAMNVIEVLRARLLDIFRLHTTASILHRWNCRILEMSLKKVLFAYARISAAEGASNADTQQLTCSIDIGVPATSMSFALGPPERNPHRCIQDNISKTFESNNANGSFINAVNVLVGSLQITLPIVRALMSVARQIENGGRYVALVYRDPCNFRWAYRNPAIGFGLRCVKKEHDPRWLISVYSSNRPATSEKSALDKELEKFFLLEDPGRVAFRNGCLTELNSTKRVLLELHALVEDFAQRREPGESSLETSQPKPTVEPTDTALGSGKPSSQSRPEEPHNAAKADERTSGASTTQVPQAKQAPLSSSDKSSASSGSGKQGSSGTASNTAGRQSANPRPGASSTAAHNASLKGGSSQSQGQNQNQNRSKGPEVVVLE